MQTVLAPTREKDIPMRTPRMPQRRPARHGSWSILPDDFEKLPPYTQMGGTRVMSGMPPFGYWEKPEEGSRIPPHRTDFGAFLTAEVIGARRCILVKDEPGLMTADPKKNRQARFIPEIEVGELISRDLDDLPVERSMLEALTRSRSVHEVLIVDGRQAGSLTRALQGENPGTRIYKKV